MSRIAPATITDRVAIEPATSARHHLLAAAQLQAIRELLSIEVSR